ncbi:Os02g0749200, partial [Oryza sativa Japonica Group]
MPRPPPPYPSRSGRGEGGWAEPPTMAPDLPPPAGDGVRWRRTATTETERRSSPAVGHPTPRAARCQLAYPACGSPLATARRRAAVVLARGRGERLAIERGREAALRASGGSDRERKRQAAAARGRGRGEVRKREEEGAAAA